MIFILLTKLSPEISKQMKDRARLGNKFNFRTFEHYALLGPYDFLDIYEAPDEKAAAKVSMISLSNGAFEAQSLTAIPYKEFLGLTEEI